MLPKAEEGLCHISRATRFEYSFFPSTSRVSFFFYICPPSTSLLLSGLPDPLRQVCPVLACLLAATVRHCVKPLFSLASFFFSFLFLCLSFFFFDRLAPATVGIKKTTSIHKVASSHEHPKNPCDSLADYQWKSPPRPMRSLASQRNCENYYVIVNEIQHIPRAQAGLYPAGKALSSTQEPLSLDPEIANRKGFYGTVERRMERT